MVTVPTFLSDRQTASSGHIDTVFVGFIFNICYHLYAGYLKLYIWKNTCFCSVSCCGCFVFTICATCDDISHVECFARWHQHFPQCAVPNMAVFFCSSFQSYRAFPVCCSGIFWMLLRWLQLSISLLVPLCSYTSRALYFCCITIFTNLFAIFLDRVCLLTLRCLLTNMFPFHYHRLWCPVCW